MNCNICASLLGQPIYESARSLTSLCHIFPESTRVRVCTGCGHLQTDAIADVELYYDEDYKILVNSEEEDQIYDVHEGVPLYRTAHQVNVLISKHVLVQGAMVLDYGCAKSSTIRALLGKREDIIPHLYDVTDRYTGFWEKFVKPSNWVTYVLPDDWFGRFDVVTSFFSLEHITRPRDTLVKIGQLLKHGGVFYAIVPNVFSNIADYIVIDHVNHFTRSSLNYLLASSGFKIREIDDVSHRGALIVVAESGSANEAGSHLPGRQEIDTDIARVEEISSFWGDAIGRLHDFESRLQDAEQVAIYGAGFYGSFLASSLNEPERIACFIDQNPYLEGTIINGVPVVLPSDLPTTLNTVLVGLNPDYARRIISDIPELVSRNLTYFYL